MKFQLYDGKLTPTLSLFANSEGEAWRILRKAGIRNRSKTLQLMQVE